MPKTEDDVERLAKTVDVERVQPAVLDLGPPELRDRAKPDAGHEVDSEPPANPGDVLLVVHGDHAGGPATLGQKGVEPVERAHVEHARAGQVLRYHASGSDARCPAVHTRSSAGRASSRGTSIGIRSATARSAAVVPG